MSEVFSGAQRFNRRTKCKSVKNAEITAAPWIAEWWQQVPQARTNPDAALERIAKLMELKEDQQHYADYVDVEHGIDKDLRTVLRWYFS